MNIKWINNESNNSAVTIYDNNITLSKKASSFFEDAFGVAVGIDTETNDIIIQKVNKEEYEKGLLELKSLHKVDIKSSYGRINSKPLVNQISKAVGLDFSVQTSYKFDAKWNNGYKMLIVSTKGGN